MSRTAKTNLFFLFISLITTFIIYSCSDNNVTNNGGSNTPEVGTMSGTITFYDTNRVYSGGYYNISVYTSWPPAGPPAGADTLELSKNGNVYTGNFKVVGLTSGARYVSVASWVKIPYQSGGVYVLGMRGCDTNTVCFFTNPKWDTLPSSQGLNNIDFKAIIDTAKSVVRF